MKRLALITALIVLASVGNVCAWNLYIEDTEIVFSPDMASQSFSVVDISGVLRVKDASGITHLFRPSYVKKQVEYWSCPVYGSGCLVIHDFPMLIDETHLEWTHDGTEGEGK